MAKISFNKLGLTKSIEATSFIWNNQEVEVVQYLSLNDKLALITKILNDSVDEYNYYNPCRLDVYMSIWMVEAYTNINFTDKQKEDISKLYDLMALTGFLDEVMTHIPEKEKEYIATTVRDTIQSIYAYKNSVMGIIETLKQDYSNATFNMDLINRVLQDNPENFAFLKEVMDKLN